MKTITIDGNDVAIILRNGRLELTIPERDDDEVAPFDVVVAIAFARGLATSSPHIQALINDMGQEVHHVNGSVGIKV